MTAVDSSTLIAYLRGDSGPDVELFDQLLVLNRWALPSVVVTEICSDPLAVEKVADLLSRSRQLRVLPGHWRRAGLTRSLILKRKLKARLADSLIAQACLDHDVPLLTRDADFRHFAKFAKLKLGPA